MGYIQTFLDVLRSHEFEALPFSFDLPTESRYKSYCQSLISSAMNLHMVTLLNEKSAYI
jgi:hypothetical protein